MEPTTDPFAERPPQRAVRSVYSDDEAQAAEALAEHQAAAATPADEEARDNERVIYKTATFSRYAIVSWIEPGGVRKDPLIAFKVLNIYKDNAGVVRVKKDGDRKCQSEFYATDFDRLRVIAEIFRAGDPLPKGTPKKRKNETGYDARQEIVLVTDNERYTRILEFLPNPNYGDATTMKVTVRDKSRPQTNASPDTFDLSQFEVRVLGVKLLRALEEHGCRP